MAWRVCAWGISDLWGIDCHWSRVTWYLAHNPKTKIWVPLPLLPSVVPLLRCKIGHLRNIIWSSSVYQNTTYSTLVHGMLTVSLSQSGWWWYYGTVPGYHYPAIVYLCWSLVLGILAQCLDCSAVKLQIKDVKLNYCWRFRDIGTLLPVRFAEIWLMLICCERKTMFFQTVLHLWTNKWW
jgi:hypothetical protein